MVANTSRFEGHVVWVMLALAACGDTTATSASTGGSTGGDTTSATAATGSTGAATATSTTTPTSGSASESGTSTGGASTTEGSTGAATTGSTGAVDPSTGTTEPVGGTSSGGSTGPSCVAPQVDCGGQCVDTDIDLANCGDCGKTCLDGQLCVVGQCVDKICEPGSQAACYDGPPGTQDVGTCKAGLQTCNDLGTAYGACEGEVLPDIDACETPVDENCDGKLNEGCWLQSCKAIKTALPDAKDGQYTIDVDGDDGPLPAVVVVCDMTIDGGGWSRFNWLLTDYTAGQDPLGQSLTECKVADVQCRGRIPKNVAVQDLMVKDLTDKTYALWKFNNGTISNAVRAALQDKVEYCAANQGAFQPYFSNSAEPYCGNGQEGGCDSFFYTSGACQAVGNWGIHWDGDGAWCAAAFKMGATKGGCGNPGDQGFLNDCACDDEKGELYYR